ncbi:MAG: sensor histidine kinase [Eubacteriales bacterium]|nr:sensor histidine kinase [Eubacteriales bacterium]
MRIRFSMQQLSLRQKLIYWLVLTIILPLLIFLPLLILYQGYTIRTSIDNICMEQSNQTAVHLGTIFDQIDSISNLYFLDATLEEVLRDRIIYDRLQYQADQKNIIALQQKYNTSIPDVDIHLTIAANDGRIYGNGVYDRTVPITELKKRWWYQDIQRNSWQTLWVRDDYLDRLHGNSSNKYVYSIRALKDFESWSNHGILIMSFLESDLVKLYGSSIASHGAAAIFDQHNNIISSVSHNDLNTFPLSQQAQIKYAGTYTDSINSKDYHITYNTVSKPQWKVVTYLPNETLFGEYLNFRMLFVLLIGVFLLALLAFIRLVSKHFVSPINRLTQEVRQIKQTPFSQRATVRSSDEIGMLASEFNQMLDQIEYLMHNIVEEQKSKRKAELQSLYAQINPHFIYNTLTSIRFLVYAEQKEVVDHTLCSFITLLKHSISSSAEFCSMHTELKMLQCYIDIQQISFEKPFDVVWDVAPGLTDCRILKLILQPIVENAVLHGLKAKKGEKRLSIRVRRQKDDILIEIADNGIGTDKVLRFYEAQSDFRSSVGLINIHSRIVMHFGHPYGVTFASKKGFGTTVSVRIPLISEQEELL